MKSAVLCFTLWVAVAAAGQQLPAGTREADDTSREQALALRVQAAETALDRGEYAQAVSLLRILRTERPKDPQIAYDLGFAEERTGDEVAATTAYKDAADLSPGMAEPRLALGLLDARAGRTAEARAELRAAKDSSAAPTELRARALRALAALDEKDLPDTSRDELLEAIKLTQETADDEALSARLAARAGDKADAEQAYRRSLASQPENLAAALGLAEILAKSSRNPEAETLLQSSLRAHPNDPQLVAALAAIYGQSGHTDAAIALLQQARTANPALADDPAARHMLGRLYALSSRNQEAAQIYASLVSTSAADPVLLDEYGGILVKLARFAEAQAVFTKAVAMRDAFPSPQDWAETESHLAFAASRNNDPRTALQALALRATVLPISSSSLFLQAISYDALHQNGEAVKAYRAFLGVASGKFPDQEYQARHRLIALEHSR